MATAGSVWLWWDLLNPYKPAPYVGAGGRFVYGHLVTTENPEEASAAGLQRHRSAWTQAQYNYKHTERHPQKAF